MAKKQSLNLLEAHLEKAAIGAAGVVFLWVIVTRFILSSGIETPDGVKRVDVQAQAAAQKATLVLASIQSKNDTTLTPVPPPENPTQKAVFLVDSQDRIPLSPGNIIQSKGSSSEEKIKDFPKKLVALRDLSIGIYHTRASSEPGVPITSVSPDQTQEVDFVTVEATFPMSQVRSLFQQAFTNAQMKEPVAHPEPIVASVELQRSQLLPNGSWSPWQRVSRLDLEPDAIPELQSENFQDYSVEQYNAILKLRGESIKQKRVLQPVPYALVTGEPWLPPTERAKQREEEEKARKALAVGPDRARTTGRPTLPGMARPGRIATAPGLRTNRQATRDRPPTMRYRGEEEEAGYSRGGRGSVYRGEEEEFGDRGYSRFPGSIPHTRVSSQAVAEAQEYLKQEEVTLWAHDGTVVPGVVYRYQMRLGFFNPIAGTDRFLPADREYKNQIILWTDFLPNTPAEYKYVQVDKRVLFFPRTASAGEKAVATVDVFRQHEGKWYQRPYTVIPGSMIGGIDPPVEKKKSTPALRTTTGRGRPATAPGVMQSRNNPLALAEPEKIDFRTGVTIIDITPKSDHWYSSGSGNSLNKQSTSDLVYRDVDGYVKRLPVDNRCWPKEIRQKRSDIMKIIRESSKKLIPRPGQRPMDRQRGGRGRYEGDS